MVAFWALELGHPSHSYVTAGETRLFVDVENIIMGLYNCKGIQRDFCRNGTAMVNEAIAEVILSAQDEGMPRHSAPWRSVQIWRRCILI
jgi:hypothetical protein